MRSFSERIFFGRVHAFILPHQCDKLSLRPLSNKVSQ